MCFAPDVTGERRRYREGVLARDNLSRRLPARGARFPVVEPVDNDSVIS